MRQARVVEVAGALRCVLDLVAAGELTASPALVARLEGAVAAVDGLAGRRRPYRPLASRATVAPET